MPLVNGFPVHPDRDDINRLVQKRAAQRLPGHVHFIQNIVLTRPRLPGGDSRDRAQRALIEHRRGEPRFDETIADTFSDFRDQTDQDILTLFHRFLQEKGADFTHSDQPRWPDDPLEPYKREAFGFSNPAIAQGSLLMRMTEDYYQITLIVIPNNFVRIAARGNVEVPLAEWISQILFHHSDQAGTPFHLEALFQAVFPLRGIGEFSATWFKPGAELGEFTRWFLPSLLHSWCLTSLPVEFIANNCNGDEKRKKRLDSILTRWASPTGDQIGRLLEAPPDKLDDSMSRNTALRGRIAELATSEDKAARSEWDLFIFHLALDLVIFSGEEQHSEAEIIGSRMAGKAYYFSDFISRLGHSAHAVLINAGLNTYQKARLINRLCEISTMRVVSLLYRKQWLGASQRLLEYGRDLDMVAKTIGSNESVELSATVQLHMSRVAALNRVYAGVTQMNKDIPGGLVYRSTVARSYYERIQQQLDGLRETRMPTTSMVGPFLNRLLAPEVNRMEAIASRYEILRKRCVEMANLIAQNMSIKQNEERAVIQKRTEHIQDAVERWATIPIAYYSTALPKIILESLGGPAWISFVIGALVVVGYIGFVFRAQRRRRQLRGARSTAMSIAPSVPD